MSQDIERACQQKSQSSVENCVPSKDHKTLVAERRSWLELADNQRPCRLTQIKVCLRACVRACVCVCVCVCLCLCMGVSQSKQSQPLSTHIHLSSTWNSVDNILHTYILLLTRYHLRVVTRIERGGNLCAHHSKMHAPFDNYFFSIAHIQCDLKLSGPCPSIHKPWTASAVQRAPDRVKQKDTSISRSGERTYAYVCVCVCLTREQGHP